MAGSLRRHREWFRSHGQQSPPHLVRPILSRIVGSSVCDVGCGSGVFGYYLRVAWNWTESYRREEIRSPGKLLGIEFSPVALERLRELSAYDEVLLAGSDRLSLENKSVDCAISVETLEHLFPSEVPRALSELARIARRRIVLATPAPWNVVNRKWLEREISEARADPVPLPYDEFLVLSSTIHKSTVAPEQMARCGFRIRKGSWRRPRLAGESVIYLGEPSSIEVEKLGEVPGVSWSGYPDDDGRPDWSEAYLDLLHQSLSIEVRT